jgi:hypothetical protein
MTLSFSKLFKVPGFLASDINIATWRQSLKHDCGSKAVSLASRPLKHHSLAFDKSELGGDFSADTGGATKPPLSFSASALFLYIACFRCGAFYGRCGFASNEVELIQFGDLVFEADPLSQ